MFTTGALLLFFGIVASYIVHESTTDRPTPGEWVAFAMMAGGSALTMLGVTVWLFDIIAGLL